MTELDDHALKLPASDGMPACAPPPPIQPVCSVALYIDGDNQSPVIAEDLLASIRLDWGLEVSRVVLASNNHGQAMPRWQTALTETLPEPCVQILCVPKTPDAADLALILELGANLEQHRTAPDLILIVSRDEWLIRAAEAVHARGARVWVAYARNEALPAQTVLPTLLLPAVNASLSSSATPEPAETTAASSTLNTILDQIRTRCEPHPDGGYRPNEVGQALYQLGLTEKLLRDRFLKSIPNLREAGTGNQKRLIF
ncbi:NYN domain-containing protein [Rhabdochromatium marinum]|uniref:NYN domain-containing protein n=1 Tax=Rhabdochromatium marinum TaxID=48729 RepID=UPI00190868A3|nr:NYN domain-containing protein [Rhabdochromatium marinum]MBK1648289.1 hypothetical protein [Rhabdochromatium marinum]